MGSEGERVAESAAGFGTADARLARLCTSAGVTRNCSAGAMQVVSLPDGRPIIVMCRAGVAGSLEQHLQKVRILMSVMMIRVPPACRCIHWNTHMRAYTQSQSHNAITISESNSPPTQVVNPSETKTEEGQKSTLSGLRAVRN